MNKIILVLLAILCFSCAKEQDLTLSTSGLELEFSTDGKIKKAILGKDNITKNISGNSFLRNCKVIDVKASKTSEKVVTFVKTIQDTLSNRSLELTETFTATENSIRWDISISDAGDFWTTPIETTFKYPSNGDITYWTPWADPRGDVSEGGIDNKLITNAIMGEDSGASTLMSWEDPLTAIPTQDALWHYGAPRYEYTNPGILYCPFRGDVISIPMISFFDEEKDLGLSLVLDLDDTILDITMNTTKEGGVTFSRFNHRIGKNNALKFSMDLVPHEADWRSALGWTTERYKKFFYPTNTLANEISGTGAYSNNDKPFDVEKMKKMAFMVNWRASFDFTFMGMFIPPVDDNEIWKTFVRHRNIGKVKRKDTSIPIMRDYCKRMDDYGFKVLSYFNVTEFGTQIEYPRPAKRKAGFPIWKHSNDYLYDSLADAMLFVPEQQQQPKNNDKGVYTARPGLPFFTWEKAVTMDPGVKSYQNFLVEQANRIIEKTPNSYGICIDRMDWSRIYNHKTDDGVSWMGGQAVGSLYMSWMDVMKRLDSVFHNNNKVIFVNNHVKRIEQLRYVDGLFDEFTYSGAALNTTGFLGVKKSTMGWMRQLHFNKEPDYIMQRFMYMGAFPLAPFPGNDHSLEPSELADKVYTEYGPLLTQLRGKEWVLEPHVIEITKGKAKTNLFKTFGGYTIPVVLGEDEAVEITIRKEELVKEGLKIDAYYVGEETPVSIEATVVDGELKINTPLKRRCVVLKINI